MQLLLVAVGCVPVLLGIALFSAWRIVLDARAVGQESGLWALAFGLEVGPLQLTGVFRSGTPKRLDAHLFGRRLSPGKLRLMRRKPAVEKLAAPEAPRKPRTPRFPPWLDPIDAALFVLDERRHLRIEELDLDLDYGFQDVTLTGKLAGALYVLSGVLPARVRINQNPRWQGAEAWQVHVDGKLDLWPGLVLAEVLWYIIRARFRRRPAGPPAEVARGTAA
jgi:hypothetical protein